jgi:hypothetical protein
MSLDVNLSLFLLTLVLKRSVQHEGETPYIGNALFCRVALEF